MSTDPPGEDLYDRIDRLVDEDPIALRDLAWKLLAERDTNAIEHNAARAEGKNAEARGYAKAVEALRDKDRLAAWTTAKRTELHNKASGWVPLPSLEAHFAAEYLETTRANAVTEERP